MMLLMLALGRLFFLAMSRAAANLELETGFIEPSETQNINILIYVNNKKCNKY